MSRNDNSQQPPGPRAVGELIASLTSQQRKVIDLTAQIQSESPDEIAFQHVVLCHLGLPRSSTDERIFERRSGNALLRLKAGEIWDGMKMVDQPLPYGSIPRLVMIAAITKAVQQKTREVELGRSMSESLRKLGLADTGAAHWRNVVKQQSALAAVEMVMGYNVNGEAKTVKAPPFDEITAWTHREERQSTLFPSRIVLSEKFFKALETHAVPLDVRAVRALSRYPMALDVYTWLAHRLYRVRNPKGDRLSWMSLREQFGQEFGEQKDFKKKMRIALKRAQLEYPKARLDTWGSGIVLLPSPPPIEKTRVVVPYLPRTAED